MKNLSNLHRFAVIAALIFMSGFGSLAEARKKKKVVPPPPDQDLTLVVPQSVMALPPVEVVKRQPIRVEFSASSWVPAGVHDQSYLENASALQSSGLPRLSFNVLGAPLTTVVHDQVKVSPIYGLAFAQLQRQASLDFGAQTAPVQQSVNFFSVRAGLQAETSQAYANLVRPFVTLSILPTYETAAMSPLSNGISQGILAAEMTTGAEFQIHAVESLLGLTSFGLEAGVEATTGLSSAFTGFGVMVGTKITI